MENNKLLVNVQGGQNVYINVYDIIESPELNKTYVIYDIDDINDDSVCVSILEEKEESYNLKTIEDEKEMKLIEEYLKDYLEKMGDNND